jgi:transcriptional regulator with XRE-family HTH domain
MTSGMLIREARLRAGISQDELGRRVGRDRAQIARWERDAVTPSFETLRELVRACGLDLSLSLTPYAVDEAQDKRLQANLRLSPHERVQQALAALSERDSA